MQNEKMKKSVPTLFVTGSAVQGCSLKTTALLKELDDEMKKMSGKQQRACIHENRDLYVNGSS